MSTVTAIDSDDRYAAEILKAGNKLVVVDFMAQWCNPCHKIAPLYARMAVKYPQAVLLKVDVDICPRSVRENNVTSMPTFLCLRRSVELDRLQGADAVGLERMIEKLYSAETGGEVAATELDVGVKGCMDLGTLIATGDSQCLNESDEHRLAGALNRGDGYLRSDCDEQLIISVRFTQAVRLHSLNIRAPADTGPKNLKVFVNSPCAITFDQAVSMESAQMIELSSDVITAADDSSLVQLRFVKFQNVTELTVFVADNQSGGDVTQIDYIGFIGYPVQGGGADMANFKRVSGKAGERHA